MKEGTSNVFIKLAERLGYPESTHLRQIFQKSLTPEEGSLLLALPASNAKLAKKFHRSEEAIDNEIQSLLRRGFVISSPKGNAFHNGIIGLWGASIPVAPELRDPEVYKLWKDWYESGWHRDLINIFGWEEGPAMRVIPAWKSIEPFSKSSPSPVIPQDDVRQLIEDAELICLHDCDCRLPLGNCCEHPMENCFQFNNGAEYNINRGAGRKISKDEALAIIAECEENGLVHQAYNRWPVSRLSSLCNCCSQTCLIHNAGLRNGRLADILAKSRYQATVDHEMCIGCQDCVDRCNYDAIEMERLPGSKRLKAVVDPEKCWGCGLCTITCKTGAMSMKLVRPDDIPQWGRDIDRDAWVGAEVVDM